MSSWAKVGAYTAASIAAALSTAPSSSFSGGDGGRAWKAIVQPGVFEGDARNDKEGSEELHVRDGGEEWFENTNGSHWKSSGEAHGNQQHQVKVKVKETVSFELSEHARGHELQIRG